MTNFETFLQLHHAEKPLLLGNAWDVASAKMLEQNGLKAIATSSAAVANTFGYKDGEHIPFDLLLQTVKRIKDNISVPLSVDMEGGFSRNVSKIIENVECLHDLGVAGINIEDSLKGDGFTMQPASVFQHILSSIAEHLAKRNMQMFINARTDAFVAKLPNALKETIARAKLYEAAGASGIFVPFVINRQDVAAIVAATKLPVNVFAMNGLPTFSELAALGIKRISMGSALYNAVKHNMQQSIETVLQEQSFKCLY